MKLLLYFLAAMAVTENKLYYYINIFMAMQYLKTFSFISIFIPHCLMMLCCSDSAVWLQDSETPYEHVDIGTLVLPDGQAPADEDHSVEVGRWGEQLVYSYLTQAARDANSRIVSVSWTNEDQETGEPFDFVVTMKNSSDPSKDLTVFIEVKSTSSDTKNFFEMSLQQIDFAREKTDAFHLYRVFNAGHQAAVRLMRLENLALKLERKEVRLCMFVWEMVNQTQDGFVTETVNQGWQL